MRTIFAQSAPLRLGKTVVVALSGGSDSVALAALAQFEARRAGSNIVLAHIHHGVRESADQDEAVAIAVATMLHVPITVRMVDAVRSDEAFLRSERYRALREIAREYHAEMILTGHTADDQTETVLLALFRGTGRAGLEGMSARRALVEGIDLVRPLLRIDRQSLRRFCERARLPYVIDPSNDQLRYRRNAVRRMLEELRPVFPGLDRAVARCSAILRAERETPADAAMRSAVREWLLELGLGDDMNYDGVSALQAAIRHRHRKGSKE